MKYRRHSRIWLQNSKQKIHKLYQGMYMFFLSQDDLGQGFDMVWHGICLSSTTAKHWIHIISKHWRSNTWDTHSAHGDLWCWVYTDCPLISTDLSPDFLFVFSISGVGYFGVKSLRHVFSWGIPNRKKQRAYTIQTMVPGDVNIHSWHSLVTLESRDTWTHVRYHDTVVVQSNLSNPNIFFNKHTYCIIGFWKVVSCSMLQFNASIWQVLDCFHFKVIPAFRREIR